mmetsp:Transcript_26644/g.63295  ORF Transcript_26644/g.63295 Transcript_26644/m.63295 type:complete len:643 (-) Transcript_26644:41-1969(-)
MSAARASLELVPTGEQSQHVNLRKSSLEILYRASGRNPKAQSAGQIDAEDQTDLHSIGCLRLFEGAVLDGSNAKRTTEKADQVSSRDEGLVFVGGSVWSMDWCPCSSEKDVLYLAVAALPQGREETPIGVQVHDKSVIQIWAISVLSEEHTTLQAPPQLEFLIAVDSEVVHSLAWCPWPGASNASRMGILAVAGGGGASWVYHVPRPTHVRAAAGTSSEEGRAGDAPPIVKLRPWVEHQCAEGYATCIAWSAQTEVPLQNKEPRSSGAAVPREPTGLGGFLAVAGTDGCTTILPCTSPAEEPGMGASGGLLSEGMVLLGAGERNGITSVAWLERGARYLATGHYDGRIKVWDTLEPLCPLHTTLILKPGWVTAITWVDPVGQSRPRDLEWGIKTAGCRRTRFGLELLPGIAFSTDAGVVGVLSADPNTPVWSIFERPFPCWDLAYLSSTLELFAACAEGALVTLPLHLYTAPSQSPDAALLNSVSLEPGSRRLVLDGSVLHPSRAQHVIAFPSLSRSSGVKDRIKNFKGMVEVDEAAWPQGIKTEPSSAPQADAPDADADMDQDGPSRKKKRRRKKDGGSAGGMGEGVQAEELLHGASGRVWTFPELDESLHRVRVSSGDAHVVAAGGRAGLVILRCMPKVK